MGYLFLAGAIGFEVFATTMLKLSNGFSELLPSLGCAVGYLLCFFMLGKALEHINLSIAYALWAALGIILTTIIAFFLFGEKITLPLIVGIALIVVGVFVVNLNSTAH
ncbi:multidrug efflux SMR transporter [Eggerthella sp. YY7918]|uniref:DMT family transporter n=1 Tax=Eggerthella sp. (strain YY7918) TaxID=502558 RepID=UPI00021713D8|nr:multidrug efflux SMR transporter [Eggerthella sp. YY7918]BAK44284.1 membrane transporter of cation [Eggerthella sp. YY7918]